MDERQKWFNRFKRCIRDMPKDIVIIVHNGSIQLCEEEERERYFLEVGDIQNVPEIDSMCDSYKVIPCGESM